MGGTRAAVAAAVVTARAEGTGARGAMEALSAAGFDVADTPYPALIREHFERDAKNRP